MSDSDYSDYSAYSDVGSSAGSVSSSSSRNVKSRGIDNFDKKVSRSGAVVTNLPPPVAQKGRADTRVGNPKRRCTDVLFILLFFLMIGGLAIVAGYAFEQGDPQKVYYPMDSQGNLCGKNNVEKAYKWIEPTLRKDLRNDTFLLYLDVTNLNATRCVNQCPSVSLPTAQFLAAVVTCSRATPATVAQLNLPCVCYYPDGAFANRCFVPYASRPIARRCVPSDLEDTLQSVKKEIDSQTAFFQRFWSSSGEDGGEGWKVIAAAIGIASGLVIIYMVIMFIAAPVVVWFTITLGWCLLALGAAWLIVKARDWTDDANRTDPRDETAVRNAEALTVTSWVVLGAVVILLLIIIFMFRRIQIAIGVIRVASKACGLNPSVFISPIFATAVALLYLAYAVYVGAYLYSAGEIEVGNNSTRTFNFNQELKGAIVYHAFGSSWIVFFIFGAMHTANAIVIARYYFGVRNPFGAIFLGLAIVLFYHFGTIAFGTLIIALVFAIRVAFQFVKQQMNAYIKNNPAAKLAVCCIECCLACFQRFLEFLTSNAFVQVAIHGDNFCTAAKKASFIIANNPARVAAVSAVSALVLFLGKVFVACLTAVICQEIAEEEDVERNYVAFFIYFVIGYIVAYIFFLVYQSSIKTILHCFIEDETHNQPDVRAPDYLAKYMDKVSAGGKLA